MASKELPKSDPMPDAVVGEDIQLTPDGGVVKTIRVLGSGANRPQKGDKVKVHYVGTLQDGSKFDSSRDRDREFEFNLGQGMVIKGWDIVVASMKKGERADVVLTADYAYGQAGNPPTIPENATLNFDIELIDFANKSHLTSDGGVTKEPIQEGEGTATPTGESDVMIRFEERLTDDTVIRSNFADKEGWVVSMLSPELLHGWKIALKTMKKGEEALIKMSARYAYGEKGDTAKGVPPNAGVTVRLRLDKFFEWKDISPDHSNSILLKVTDSSSSGFEEIKDGDQVKLELKVVEAGKADGVAKAFDHVVGEGWLVDSLDLVLRAMKRTDKVAVVKFSGATEFGLMTQGKVESTFDCIPANADVEMFINVLDVKPSANPWDLSDAEKITLGQKRKNMGNEYFKKKKFRLAIERYEKSKELFNHYDNFGADHKSQADDLVVTCNLNMAQVYLSREDFTKVVELTTSALEKKQGNVKALYRRATALAALNVDLEAERDFKAALAIEPANPQIRAGYAVLRKKMKAEERKAKKIFGGMFDKFVAEDEAKQAKEEEAKIKEVKEEVKEEALEEEKVEEKAEEAKA